MSNSKFVKGLFKPNNPKKYLGDSSKIIYRSSWEFYFNRFLDGNPNILAWASEPIAIPYIKPTDGKVHKYYVDYFVRYLNSKREVISELIEVKPKRQTTGSKARKPSTRLYEDITYAINQAKWKAASDYAESQGLTFRIITEDQLFFQK